MPSRLLATVVGLVAVVGSVTACTIGPSDRPPVAVRGGGLPPPPPDSPSSEAVRPPPPGAYDPDSLAWRECADELGEQLGAPPALPVDCADLNVESDVAVPGFGLPLTLDVTRIGTGPAPLVVLDEPTAEPGTLRAVRLAQTMPSELLDGYTLIGVARRGTGTREPLDCVDTAVRDRLTATDPNTGETDALGRVLDTARTAIQTCQQDVSERLTVLDSTRTADDLEQLRAQLGAPVVNLIAFGTASRAATDFLRRYPTSVGRLVLDGAADPTVDGIGAAESAALAAEAGFDAFVADCVANGCPLGPNPRARLGELTQRLRVTPLQVGPQLVGPGTAYQATLEVLGTPERWPELATALSDALDGRGDGIAALVAPSITGVRGQPARFDPALAYSCNDTATRVPPERARQLVEQWRTRAPMYGPPFAQRLLLCSSWPVPAPRPEAPTPDGSPPVVVIGSVGDPITPVSGATRTAEQIPSSVTVSWQGRAHGALGRSGCVADLVVRYLLDAAVPTSGTLCPP